MGLAYRDSDGRQKRTVRDPGGRAQEHAIAESPEGCWAEEPTRHFAELVQITGFPGLGSWPLVCCGVRLDGALPLESRDQLASRAETAVVGGNESTCPLTPNCLVPSHRL